MRKQTLLKAILVISIAGMLFSGYLSYTELFTSSPVFCTSQAQGCPSCSQSIAQIPVCVYGFIMYLALFILSILAIKAKK